MNPHAQHALVLFEQHRFGEAESQIELLLTANPDDSTAHAMMGLCLYLQHRGADAVTHARQSLALSPDLAGYDRVTRALMDLALSLQAQPAGCFLYPGLAGGARSSSAPSLSLAQLSVDHVSPPSVIESFLEHWRQLLEASVPGLSGLNPRPQEAASPQRCVCRKATARKPLSLLRQGRFASCNLPALRHGESRSCGRPVERHGAFRLSRR